jgi:hypothetical protein
MFTNIILKEKTGLEKQCKNIYTKTIHMNKDLKEDKQLQHHCYPAGITRY